MTLNTGIFDVSDPQNPDRVYSAALLSRILSKHIRDGIVHGDGNEMAVTVTDPPAMSVQVGTGTAMVRGRFCENDAALTLSVPAAHATYPRIDRVVVRLNASPGRTIDIVVKPGTPAPEPAAPALTRTAEIWELSLAQVRVEAGATSILSAKITDERGNASLCGVACPRYIPSSALEIVTALPMQGMPITGLPAPTGETHAARKAYVDEVIRGFGISQIAIDADKDWGGKSITNMKALTLTESSTPGLLMIYPTNSIIWQSSIQRSTSSTSYTELKRVTSSHTGSIRIRLTVSTSSAYSDSGTIGIVVGGRLQAEVGADVYGAVTKTVDVLVGAGEIISFQGRVSHYRATVTLTNVQIMGSLGCVPYSTQTPTVTVNVD